MKAAEKTALDALDWLTTPVGDSPKRRSADRFSDEGVKAHEIETAGLIAALLTVADAIRDTKLYTAENAQDVREALEAAQAENANLRGADLRGANLRYAKGVHPARVTDLHMLHDQVGKIRAYKLVTAEGYGPFNGGVKYEVGKTVEVEDADTDPHSDCGAGINLATLPWCLANWREGCRVLLCEFAAKDIAAIPTATDGKFRVRKCKVIREVDLEPIFAAEREEPA